MFRSIQSRLLATYLLVTGVVLLLVGASFFVFVASNPRANPFGALTAYNRLQTVADVAVERVRDRSQLQQPRVFERALRLLRERGELEGLILDPGGRVLFSSLPEAAQPSEADRAEWASQDEALQGEFSADSGQRWLFVTRRLSEGRTLVLASPAPTIRTVPLLVRDVLPALLQAGLVALLVSLLLAALASRWVAGPLQRVGRAARRVASGDYDHKVSPAGPAEAEDVALAFNDMIDTVRAGQHAMRDFVANVSHELKTPLTSIQGFAQAIIDGTARDDAARRHAARVIYAESDRLRRLVDDLLDLARLDAGQVSFDRDPLDLGALIHGVRERLAHAATEKALRVEADMADLPRIIGDGDRLAQVFINLLDNAIQHSPEGSSVKIGAQAADGWITVHVQDSGPGIRSEELPRIFERFYQLDKARSPKSGRGVGLGLAISKEIVQAHGGRIWAESVPGLGSRFSVQLPVATSTDETLPRRRG